MEANLKQKPSVLLADDDADLLLLMEMKMRAEGFAVEVSPNAEHIYEMVAAYHPDLILLDISMQGVNGDDICKQLKSNRETRHIPVILFSAHENIRGIASACGADDYIAKPLSEDNMKQRLMQVLYHSI